MAETIRVGRVSSIDYAKGLVSVTYPDQDGSVTKPFPMLSEWYGMPNIGDLVMVLHLSNGAEAGLVLGRYWNDKNVPKESGAGLFRMDLNRDGTAYIKCSGTTITILGNITLNGNLTVNGDVTVKGDITADGTITASVDVVSGGISLKNHTHTGDSGGSTSPPK